MTVKRGPRRRGLDSRVSTPGPTTTRPNDSLVPVTFRILVVCTGNICRSAMAEVVLRHRAVRAGIGVEVASAGTSDEEEGNPMDPRAASVLADRGYAGFEHLAHQVAPEDLDADLILAMTRRHRRALLDLGADPARTRLWTEFIPDSRHPDVADPWYGDRRDFEETLTVIETGAPTILAAVRTGSEPRPQD